MKWVLKSINEVLNFYYRDVCVSPKKSLKIVKVLVQRKG
ncbi:hypothetical protein DCO58_03435 [Helicobacter saguini]|uniref:Uncharacterized protein n=1 Tax=Helicobacter saguini TaxID=1548018 RepID=A0A347VU85_9HELI|nr:hypothetical protein [Helicobacter saguini]MWV62575.1 hypothetical protein [Helicobacter saguini]MWV66751.1 hypothetical protein [Helicobacter saguini]MWV69102.1 hypothetical protein [Helicobacter saguini]MWV71343.1 hypothetical protein [Helicobacter saguini]TLD91540.1 hypothetical protein LS64_011820 [Helicobacter saguini]